MPEPRCREIPGLFHDYLLLQILMKFGIYKFIYLEYQNNKKIMIEKFIRVSTTLPAQQSQIDDDDYITGSINRQMAFLEKDVKSYRILNYDSTFIPDTPEAPGYGRVIISVGIAYTPK